MSEEFLLDIIAVLNQQLSKKKIKEQLKGMDNSMFVKVISKLSIALSQRQLKKDLKQLNDLYLQVGADLKIDSALKKKLQGRIKTLQDSISDLQIGVRAKDSDIAKTVTEARNKGQRAASRTSINFNIEVKKEKAIADLEYMAKKYSKLFSNVSASQKYNNILDAAYGITDSKQLSSVRAQIAAFTSELKANDLASQSLGDKWRTLILRSKDLFSAASAVTLIFSQVKQAVSSFLQLDTAMTNLYKVQNQITGRDQFSGLLTRWNKLAQNLAVTTQSLIGSMEAWSKIGFDLDMSKQLAEITAIFEKTAEISNEKATSTLISAAQAFTEIDDFGVDDYVKRVEAVGNKINAIGNKYAIDSEGIADGLQNASAALKVAGNDLNETISLITATNKIFQSPEEGSNMLKVASMRLRGQVDALKEMGEDAEGVSTDITKIQQQVYELTGNKVNIFEDDENLKSTYQMILEIGEVFGSLNDRSQADLLEVMFGKQRASAGASLLLNYEELEKIKNDSIHSANSMAEEYSKYMESVEASLTIFKEKLVETYSTFMSGDLIKYTADMGSGLLDLVNATGLLQHSLVGIISLNIGKGITSIGASIAATVKQMNTLGNALQQVKNLPVDEGLRKESLQKLGEETKNLTEKNLKLLLSQKQLEETDRIIILGAHDLTSEEAKLKLEKMGLLSVTKTQTAANVAEAATTGTLKNAMLSLKATIADVGITIKGMFASNPIGMWLLVISTGISLLTSVINKQKQKQEEARQAMQDAKQEYQDLTAEVDRLNEELKTTQERLKELDAAGYNSLSLVEQEEYDRLKAANDELERELRIKEALAKVKAKEVADNARKNLDSESEWSIEKYVYGAGREQVDKIDSLNEYLNLAEQQKKSLEDAQQELKDYENTYAGTAEEMVQDKSWQKLNENVEKAETALSDTEQTISKKFENIEEESEGLVDSFGNVVSGCEEMYRRVEVLKNRVDKYFNPETGTADGMGTVLGSVLEEPENNTQAFFEQLTKGKDSLDKFQSSVKSASDAYATLLSGNYSTSELLDSIQTINKAVSDMGGSLNWEFINRQTNSLELLGDAIQHISQKYAESVLSGAGIDINSDFGKMLADMIQEAYETEAAFAGMNAQLDNLQSSYQTLTGILESYNETGYISLDSLQSLLTADENLIAMLQVENGQLTINQEAYENLVAVQLMEFKAKLNDAAAAEIEALAKQKAEQATNQNADASNNAVAKLDAETAAFGRNTSAAIANAVAKAEESGVSAEEIQGVFDKYTEVWNSAMNNYSGDFSGFMDGGKSAASKAGSKAADAYLEAFQKEYDHLKDLLDRGEISEAQYLNRLRSLYTRYFKDRKEYLDEYKKYESEYLTGMLDLHNKALSGISTLLGNKISAANDAKDSAISALEEEKEAAAEAYQAQIDAIEEEKDAIDDLIKEKEKKIDALNEEADAIRKTAETRKKNIDLQKEEYNLERMLNQRTTAVYKEGEGFVFETDTAGIRDAREKVKETKEELEIDRLQREADLIQKEIDLLEEKKDALTEEQEAIQKMLDDSNKYYDNLIKQQEKMWDSMIKGMEQQKSKWEELADIQEIAEAYSAVQQVFGELGYSVEDVLNGSEAAFEDFKSKYISLISDVNSNSDFTDGLVYATGVAKENLGSFLEKTKETGTGIDELASKGEELNTVAEGMGSLSSTASDANTNLAETVTNVGNVAANVGEVENKLTNVNTLLSGEQTAFSSLKQIIDEVIEAINQKTEAIQNEQNAVGIAVGSELSNFQLLINKIMEVKEKLDEVNNTVTTMDRQPVDNLTESFQSLYEKILLVSSTLGAGMEDQGGSVTNSIASAIQALNNISLEEGIIAQFTNLKTAIDSVSSAISGGGGESPGGENQGANSGSTPQGGESGEKGESGGGSSLAGAIETMGETAKKIIGEPDAEGDGTLIGEFGSLETAVTDVTSAIGGGESEGGNEQGNGEEDSDSLVGSIVNLGETAKATLGEPDGDGVIGRFGKFEDVIAEANEQVTGIAKGLADINNTTVECTIKINIESDGFPSYAAGTALGAMNLESSEYNAKYEGNAHVSGTANVTGNWGVRKPGKSLVGEIGQELWVHAKNGTFETVGDNGPEWIKTEKDDLIFNHLQTKELLDKGNIVKTGKAYANGTIEYSDGTTILPDGNVLRPLQPGDKMYDLVQKFDAYLKSIDGNLEKLVPNSLYEQNREWNKLADQITYANSVVNNRNVQQPVTIQIGDINLTGVQDVNGLAHAIKTRLPGQMMQGYFKR